MNRDAQSFLALSDQDRRDVYEAAASRLDTLPSYVEKDFWVSLVLDLLYNRLPNGHPDRILKGGTSLSKAFGLIERFSEDIDFVVFRDGLGFVGERDPTVVDNISNAKRRALFKELVAACSCYVLGDLKTELTTLLGKLPIANRVVMDEDDNDRQTLLVEYPSLYGDSAYVSPRVKIEAGARSATVPAVSCSIRPYIAEELSGWVLNVRGIRAIAPERTYWEKLLILHGLHCGYRDEERVPADRHRLSRHYYDAAILTDTEIGKAALANPDLLRAVREHNLRAFRQAWKRFEEAVPGSVRLVPQSRLRAEIERDYEAMQGMILGDVPDFGWIIEQLQYAESSINRNCG